MRTALSSPPQAMTFTFTATTLPAANGRMLQLRQAELDNYDETSGPVDTQSVAATLSGAARADHVKIFLLDQNSMPVLAMYREDL